MELLARLLRRLLTKILRAAIDSGLAHMQPERRDTNACSCQVVVALSSSSRSLADTMPITSPATTTGKWRTP